MTNLEKAHELAQEQKAISEYLVSKLSAEKTARQKIYLSDIADALECFRNDECTLAEMKLDIAAALRNIEEIEKEYMLNY